MREWYVSVHVLNKKIWTELKQMSPNVIIAAIVKTIFIAAFRNVSEFVFSFSWIKRKILLINTKLENAKFYFQKKVRWKTFYRKCGLVFSHHSKNINILKTFKSLWEDWATEFRLILNLFFWTNQPILSLILTIIALCKNINSYKHYADLRKDKNKLENNLNKVI